VPGSERTPKIVAFVWPKNTPTVLLLKRQSGDSGPLSKTVQGQIQPGAALVVNSNSRKCVDHAASAKVCDEVHKCGDLVCVFSLFKDACPVTGGERAEKSRRETHMLHSDATGVDAGAPPVKSFDDLDMQPKLLRALQEKEFERSAARRLSPSTSGWLPPRIGIWHRSWVTSSFEAMCAKNSQGSRGQTFGGD
jgi:hypothetical protein